MDTINETQTVPAPTGTSGRAGGAWRLLAFLIDCFLLSLVTTTIKLSTGYSLGTSLPGASPLTNWEQWLVLLVVGAYFVLTLKFYGGSLGKMVLGLYVQSRNGNPVSWQTAVLREIVGKPISFATFGLGFLWLTWDKEKQGFHDKIADTVVWKSNQT
jgi:uncharacterized RDD family membrane protein YckC